MEVVRFSLGQLQTNCYLFIQGRNCLIIDPADEASFILEELQRRALQPLAMLATHGHFDHIMAAGEIQLSFHIPLYIFKEDAFLVKRLNKTAEYFLGYNPHILLPHIVKYLKEEPFDIQNSTLQVIRTPGHTPGSCSWYAPQEKIVFTGDALFKGSVGRYDFSYSNKNHLRASLRSLLSLPEETVVYAGHGEETTIQDEQKNNLLHLLDLF